jgi:hypothetical protein
LPENEFRLPGFIRVISVPIARLRGEPADVSVHNGGVTPCDRSLARRRRQNGLRTSRLHNQCAKFSLAHQILSMIGKVSEALRLQPVAPCSFEVSIRVRRRPWRSTHAIGAAARKGCRITQPSVRNPVVQTTKMQTTWMQTTWIMNARMSSRLSVIRDGPTVREEAGARHQAIATGAPYRRLLIPC